MTIRPRKKLGPARRSIVVPVVRRLPDQTRMALPEQTPGEFAPHSLPVLRTWTDKSGLSHLGDPAEEALFRDIERSGLDFSFRSRKMGGHPSLDEWSSFLLHTPGKWTAVRLTGVLTQLGGAAQISKLELENSGYNVTEVDESRPSLGGRYGR